MNELKGKIYAYLEFHNIRKSQEIDELIEQFTKEITSLNSFKCVYKKFSEPIEFLKKEPYFSFLSGSKGYYLCVMTLGIEIDNVIHKLFEIDQITACIYDCCANAYLEFKAEEYESNLEKDLSYKFAPGYQGSDIKDLRKVFDILEASKLDMYLTDEFRIVPSKSMVGIIGIGTSVKKQCGKCMMISSCAFRKAGKRCFNL